ncbi:hypothetical protein ARMSODRAFT_953672 [Armillaria solidipes]|uniref:Uncharacterized protein n=1 Tax=Armillaria solidipes TaxID=1076256 RepID=A0A2H3BW33_9AGAR|nr:hypothetical protein ARMSODRAFT_953672 [Armillaria solidipes]
MYSTILPPRLKVSREFTYDKKLPCNNLSYDNLSSGVLARMLWRMVDFKSGFRYGSAVVVPENSVSVCVGNLVRGADSTVVGGCW